MLNASGNGGNLRASVTAVQYYYVSEIFSRDPLSNAAEDFELEVTLAGIQTHEFFTVTVGRDRHTSCRTRDEIHTELPRCVKFNFAIRYGTATRIVSCSKRIVFGCPLPMA